MFKVNRYSLGTKLGAFMVVVGLVLLLLPITSIYGQDTSGPVSLKGSHVNQPWDYFEQDDCDSVSLEPGQVLWHLVLSPLSDNATATIDGVSGEKHGGSIHWTFINNSTTSQNWVAQVTDGLIYNPGTGELKSELRVPLKAR